jgi:hypothetical protein
MSLILSGSDGVSDIDGSAATPAIRGTDTNTGIFFGSDIIGFSEDGTEVARFNSSGNLVLNNALTTSTLNAPSGVLATQNGMTGIAKSWLRYDGGTETINASFNVSSVTRSSGGRYVVNFTTAMPSANYTALANACFGSGTASNIVLGNFGTSSYSLDVLFGGGYSDTAPITSCVFA